MYIFTNIDTHMYIHMHIHIYTNMYNNTYISIHIFGVMDKALDFCEKPTKRFMSPLVMD